MNFGNWRPSDTWNISEIEEMNLRAGLSPVIFPKYDQCRQMTVLSEMIRTRACQHDLVPEMTEN